MKEPKDYITVKMENLEFLNFPELCEQVVEDYNDFIEDIMLRNYQNRIVNNISNLKNESLISP